MIYAVHTDKGRHKKINQDSVIVRKASTSGGELIFAAVCDGMGGLSHGENASAEVVVGLQDWFQYDLPMLIFQGMTTKAIQESLTRQVLDSDEKIVEYSRKVSDCGTTLSGVLLCGGRCLCVNIGDSRVYRIHNGQIELLTHDQTVVQQLLDDGEITPEQAAGHCQKNVLLQCIGVEGDVVPQYTEYTYEKNDLFIICSDGFRHTLSKEEIAGFFPLSEMRTEKAMKRCCIRAVEENIRRGEKDNITVAVIRT